MDTEPLQPAGPVAAARTADGPGTLVIPDYGATDSSAAPVDVLCMACADQSCDFKPERMQRAQMP